MFSVRRIRPRIEVLESRDVLDATLGTSLPPPVTVTASSTAIIDPTLNPSDPSATSLQVTVTGVGQPVNGQILSVTVTGLSASNLQPGSSYQLMIGGVSYSVTAVSPVQGGGYQILFSTGIPSGALSVGSGSTLVIGGGATTPTPPATPTPPPATPVIDPTLNPTP